MWSLKKPTRDRHADLPVHTSYQLALKRSTIDTLTLWRRSYRSVNIGSRTLDRLHPQHGGRQHRSADPLDWSTVLHRSTYTIIIRGLLPASLRPTDPPNATSPLFTHLPFEARLSFPIRASAILAIASLRLRQVRCSPSVKTSQGIQVAPPIAIDHTRLHVHPLPRRPHLHFNPNLSSSHRSNTSIAPRATFRSLALTSPSLCTGDEAEGLTPGGGSGGGGMWKLEERREGVVRVDCLRGKCEDLPRS